MTNSIEKEKFDTDEAAKYTKLSASTLAKRRVFGGGPKYLKLGRRVVYSKRDLDDWLDAHRRTSTSDSGKKTSEVSPNLGAGAHATPPQLHQGKSSAQSQASERGNPHRKQYQRATLAAEHPRTSRRAQLPNEVSSWAKGGSSRGIGVPPGPIGLLLKGKRPMLVPHAKSERKIKFSRACES